MKRSTLIGLLCFLFLTSTAFAEGAAGGTAAPPAPAGAADGGGAPGGEGGGAPEPGAASRPKWETDLDALSDNEPAAGAAGGTPAGGDDKDKDKDKNRDRRGGAPAKPGTKPAAAPAGGAAPDPDEPPANLTTNAELRKWAQDQRKLARQHEATVAQLNKRVTDYEKQVKDAGNPVEMAKQLATMKQQVEDYEQRVRMIDYQQSAEYRDKYEKPYTNAWSRALKEVGELEVTFETGEKDEQGNPKLGTRAATKGDFQYIMQLPLGKAAQASAKLFKENSAIVMNHYNRIREMHENANAAVEEYKTKGKEHEEAKRAQAQSAQAAHNTLWKTANERMSEDPKRQEFWGKSEDPAEQAELDKGFALADQLFGDAYDKLSMEDKILLHASIRHHVAGFRKLAFRNKNLRAEIATLNATIAELRGSGPGKPGGGGGGGGGGEKKTWAQGIDALPE